MIEPRPTVVVFGLDPDANPRAGRFAKPDAEIAVKADGLLGYQVARISDAEFLEALPDGNVFAHGIGFIRRVSQAAFEKLVALAVPEKAGVKMSSKSNATVRICALNDALRRFGRGGRVMMTSGIEALGSAVIARIMAAIAGFDVFTADNDPHGEHDCAILDVDGIRVLFKVDYYDRDLAYHSPDASDPSVTRRVMTVMRADEY